MRPADDSPIAGTKVLSGFCASQASTQGARSILSALCVWSLPATEHTESDRGRQLLPRRGGEPISIWRGAALGQE